MNLNPIKLIQNGLAHIGIGGLYLYTHPLLQRKSIVEGPYIALSDLNKDATKIQDLTEWKFHFRTPIGATKPRSIEG